MLWTIAVIFILLWLLGLATSVTLGGFVHILAVAGVLLLVVRFVKRPGHKSSGSGSATG